MPFFRVELTREVSRRVDLRQETTIVVEAPDLMAATGAASSIAWDEEELCKYMDEWKDYDASRQASNDEVERRPRVERAGPCRMPYTTPWLKAMPEPEVHDAE